jgi:hypothetical protein
MPADGILSTPFMVPAPGAARAVEQVNSARKTFHSVSNVPFAPTSGPSSRWKKGPVGGGQNWSSLSAITVLRALRMVGSRAGDGARICSA